MYIRIILALLFSISLFASHTLDFFHSFDTLKSENWKSLIDIGEKALKEKPDPKIHARLASTYFYLGKYEEMKSHIDACFFESLDEESDELLIRSLYLLSAYHRVNKNYSCAKQVIKKALTKARAHNQLNLLSKVLFNAGAVETDDPKGKVDLAQKYYEEALSYLTPDSDDAHRVQIRLGKVYLLKKEFYKLPALLSTLSKATLTTRTRVHFYYLSAQVALAKGALQEADRWIEQGLNLAKQLEMTQDYQRFESLK